MVIMFISKSSPRQSVEPASLQRCFADDEHILTESLEPLRLSWPLHLIPQCDLLVGAFSFSKKCPDWPQVSFPFQFSLFGLSLKNEDQDLTASCQAAHFKCLQLINDKVLPWLLDPCKPLRSLQLEEPVLSWCLRHSALFQGLIWIWGLKRRLMIVNIMMCFKYLGKILRAKVMCWKHTVPSVTVCACPHQQLQGHFLILEVAGMQFNSDSKLLLF